MSWALEKAGKPWYARAPNAFEPYRYLLGPSCVAVFHRSSGFALAGSTVVSWTDRLRRITVPAAGVSSRPDYNTTSSAFGNGPSMTTGLFTTTPNSGLISGSDLTPNQLGLGVGGRPYIMSVFRRTTLSNTTVERELFALVAGGGSGLGGIEIRGDNTLTNFIARYNNSNTAPLPCTDLLPHIGEAWCIGSTLKGRLDGGSIVTGTGGATSVALLRICIGELGIFTRWGDFEHVLHIVCNSYPGDGPCAAARAYAHVDLSF